MYALLDFDNIDKADLRRGAEALVTNILDTMGVSNLADPQRIVVRLYGGWFSGTKLSQRAQKVSADLAQAFQAPLVVARGDQSRRIIARAQLADALLVQPRQQLPDTYRQGAAELRRYSLAQAPFAACCAPGACPLHAVLTVARDGLCPMPSCQVSPSHVMTRHEQKLVDTMLVADLIEIARQRAGPAIVVSSDDDLWPGILAATTLGTRVFHFQSRSRTTPVHYSAQAPASHYSQHVLPHIP
jgi:hypothetical protein